MKNLFKRKKILAIGSIVVAVCIIIISASNEPEQEVVPTGVSEKGDLIVKLIESGDVFATNSRVITAPSGTKSMLQITYLALEGTTVKKGDVLARFDPKNVESRIENYARSLDQYNQDRKKLVAQHESAMDALYSDLTIMENTFKLAELNLLNLQFESDSKKKEGELQFKNAQINLNEQKEKIKNQKIINDVELNNADLKIKDATVKLAFWKDRLKALTVLAPIPGLVVHHEQYDWMNRTYVKVKEGDTVWEGMPIMQLPDTYEMKVQLRVNEVDVGRLRTEQKAAVILDAYPELEFTGTIETISAIVEDLETNVREFNVEIVIDEKDNPYFRPGMTARIEIITKILENVVYVPNETIFELDGQPVVFVDKNGFKKRSVIIGARNLNYVEIKENLAPGEKIALKDPTGSADLLGTAEKKRLELAQRKAIIEKFADIDFSALASEEESNEGDRSPRKFEPTEETIERYADRLLQ